MSTLSIEFDPAKSSADTITSADRRYYPLKLHEWSDFAKQHDLMIDQLNELSSGKPLFPSKNDVTSARPTLSQPEERTNKTSSRSSGVPLSNYPVMSWRLTFRTQAWPSILTSETVLQAVIVLENSKTIVLGQSPIAEESASPGTKGHALCLLANSKPHIRYVSESSKVFWTVLPKTCSLMSSRRCSLRFSSKINPGEDSASPLSGIPSDANEWYITWIYLHRGSLDIA